MADRHIYVPSVGLLVLIIWGGHELTRGWRHQATVLSLAGAAAAVLCMALTRQQLGYWQDSETLFRHALEVTQNNYFAHKSVGDVFIMKGQTDEAIGEYRESLRLKPDYPQAHDNLGNAFLIKGRTDEAISQFREAIRVKPDYADAHNNLGAALCERAKLTKPSAKIRKPSASNRITPMPTTISAPPWSGRAALTRRSANSRKPSGSNRITPTPTTVLAPPWA